MRKIQMLCAAVMAMLSLIALAAVSPAFAAAPKFLPETGVTSKATSGAGKLETAGGSKIECTSDEASTSEEKESGKLGSFKVAFKGCEAFGFIKCNTPGDAEGVVLTSGTFHIRLLKASPAEAAILYLVTPFKIECFGNTIEVKGSLACTISPQNTKTTSFTSECKAGSGKGEQAITEVFKENSETEKEKVGLESKFNSGSFEKSNEVTTEKITTNVSAEVMG
jgi:hypothetical protein